MIRLCLMAFVVALLAGCQHAKLEDSKEQAQKRWYNTRSQLLYGVAAEHLKCGHLDKAAAKCHEALSLNPDCVDARLLLGKVLIEQGQFALAAPELAKAAEQMPKASEPVYLLAVAQERGGQLAESIQTYRRAQALAPGNMEPVKAAAEVMILSGKKAEARAYLESYLHSADNDPGAYELAGRLAMMDRDYAKAAFHYRHAVDLDTENLLYRQSLGEAQFLARNYVEAADIFEDLLANPKYVATSATHCRLGECQLAIGKALLARDQFYKATELSPELPGVWMGLSKAALAAGDTPRSLLAAQKALRLVPGDHDATLLLGYALLKDNQAQRAIDLLVKAAGDHPQSCIIQCVLGRAYSMLNQKAMAAECYTEAFRIDPQNQLARELAALTDCSDRTD